MRTKKYVFFFHKIEEWNNPVIKYKKVFTFKPLLSHRIPQRVLNKNSYLEPTHQHLNDTNKILIIKYYFYNMLIYEHLNYLS